MVGKLINKLAVVTLSLLSTGCDKTQVNVQNIKNESKLEEHYPIFSRDKAGACGLATGDFNRDGLTDLAVGDLNGVEIYFGRKEDGFSFVYSHRLKDIMNQRNEGGASGIASYDFNKDGWTDLLVGDVNGLRIFHNNKGKFGEYSYLFVEDNFPHINYRESDGGACGLEATDLDGDGKPEIIWGNINCGTGIYNIVDKNKLKLKNILGDIINSRHESDGCSGVTTGDIDSDGVQELFVSDRFGLKTINLSKAGYFERQFKGLENLESTADSAYGLATGDFNRDGLTDLLVGDRNGVKAYLGREHSDFSEGRRIKLFR